MSEGRNSALTASVLDYGFNSPSSSADQQHYVLLSGINGYWQI